MPLWIGLQPVPNYGKHDLELGIVNGRLVRELPSLLVGLLRLDALVDEEDGIAPIVNDEVGPQSRARLMHH
ncbi:hypothetical protein NL676_021070 [Syzygium grande]|nr:hypothetical protein NL676_021070 [Syzygium grande]